MLTFVYLVGVDSTALREWSLAINCVVSNHILLLLLPSSRREILASTASQGPREREVPRERSDPSVPLALEDKWASRAPRESRGCKDLRARLDSRAPPCPYREDWDDPTVS